MPLGALWIQGYGPTGEGAATDNLVTVKSLNGVTIDRNTQISLFSGILNLLGVDPSYRSRVSIRLGNVTIVRVKDISKLEGPAGEPRLFEALKAGTVTISTENDAGLGLSSRYSPTSTITGRGDASRKRSFSIDGSDLFIAFRVATLKETAAKEIELPLRRVKGGVEATLEPYRIKVDTADLDNCVCGAPSGEAASNCMAEKAVSLSLEKMEVPAPLQAKAAVLQKLSEEVSAVDLELPCHWLTGTAVCTPRSR